MSIYRQDSFRQHKESCANVLRVETILGARVLYVYSYPCICEHGMGHSSARTWISYYLREYISQHLRIVLFVVDTNPKFVVYKHQKDSAPVFPPEGSNYCYRLNSIFKNTMSLIYVFNRCHRLEIKDHAEMFSNQGLNICLKAYM